MGIRSPLKTKTTIDTMYIVHASMRGVGGITNVTISALLANTFTGLVVIRVFASFKRIWPYGWFKEIEL